MSNLILLKIKINDLANQIVYNPFLNLSSKESVYDEIQPIIISHSHKTFTERQIEIKWWYMMPMTRQFAIF